MHLHGVANVVTRLPQMPIPTSGIPERTKGLEEPRALGPRQSARSHGSSRTGNENGSEKATGAGVNTGAGSTREKTEQEKEADRRYEEAMEDEYAKRDGGA
ncbi:hypothetical protein BJ170DRAFT_678569 [Xylariales sp. AK1849]|nr:hypothetical protein BJ170DRAFT_678569 [Xylariales sp. AK1849]